MKKKTDKWLHLTIFSFLLFVSLVIGVSYYTYKVHVDALKEQFYSELESVAGMKWSTFYNWRVQHVSNAFYLTNIHPFVSQIKEFLNHKNGFKLDKESKATFELLTKGTRYSSIMLIDSTNKEYLLAGKKIVLSDSSKRIIKRSFNRYGVYFADFQFEEGLKNPYVLISCSLSESIGKNRKTFAVLVFSVNLKQGFLSILNSKMKTKQSFETIFALPKKTANGKSYQLKFADFKCYGFGLTISNIPYIDNSNLRLKEADYEGPDFDGKPIMAKIKSGLAQDWLLVTKMDMTSFNKYKRNFGFYIFGFDLIFIIIGFVSIYVTFRYNKILRIKEAYNILLEKQAFQIRYETILKNANDAIMLFNKEGQIIEVNDMAITMYGYNKKELCQLKIPDFWKDDRYHQIIDNIDKINLINGYVFESKHLKKDKSEFPVEVSARQIEIEGEKYYQTIIRDITDRKIAEQNLIESKEKYKELVENINDVIFTVSETGIVNYISPVIENILGYLPNEMIGKNFTEFISKTDKERFLNNPKELFSRGTKTNIITLIKKSGEICHGKISTRAAINYNNELIITGSLIDITQEKKLELLLNKEREDLRTIINLSPVAIYFKDKENNYIRVNKAAALTANANVEDLEGKSAKEFYPDSYEKYQRDDYDVVKTGKPKFGIIENLKLKDKVIRLRSDKVPWYNEFGEISGVICFSVDITEQFKAEEELRREKNLLQWILSTIPVGLLYLNKDGEIIFGNLAAESILGLNFNDGSSLKYNSQELRIRDYNGNLIKDEEKPFALVKNSNGPIKGILQSFIKGKERIMMSVNISPLISNEGDFEGAVASIEDITTQKTAEEKLRQSEKRYRSLFEGMLEGFAFHQIICNEEGQPVTYKFLEVNPAFEKMTGLNGKDIIGKTAYEILPKMEPYWIEEYGKVALNGDYSEFENYSSDLEKYFRVSVFSNQKEYFAVIFEDITDRKKIENELQVYRENLERLVKVRTQELNKTNALLKEEIEKGKGVEVMLQQSLDQVQKFSDLKSRFISTASHEFRTPLATMFSSTELLEAYGRKWNIEKYTEHISRIKHSIENLTYLIDDVLSVSKVEAGKIEYEPSEFDFEEFCRNLVKEFQNDLAKSHIIDFSFKPDRKRYILDERLFRSILMNLLSNAVKYSDRGETIIFTITSNNMNIIIEVIDNGIGISPDDLPYLFEPFHRGVNVNQISGTGLGMSIVKRYVDLHDGEILVDSKLDFGTKIKIIIPIKKI